MVLREVLAQRVTLGNSMRKWMRGDVNMRISGGGVPRAEGPQYEGSEMEAWPCDQATVRRAGCSWEKEGQRVSRKQDTRSLRSPLKAFAFLRETGSHCGALNRGGAWSDLHLKGIPLNSFNLKNVPLAAVVRTDLWRGALVEAAGGYCPMSGSG